ncbi:hypothetical protein AMAG_02861 [Allomyces macrogynus ATCC 38327]|uniref:protein-tyrosine-phosphatase n=1 Tax=Allomyces macrogynus (strain ATCC 38327) TaxID=578462 RepID=A0A0L0S3Y3_ALLM3|nr:hypothetical protein AMAG_02861 [Allomyces macrogynus ATCC 38327]|eukprot:KNE57111.1 hypothetical protein AMAG_02861 [Allomyces macrogynus ATCC 38327]
MSNLKPSLSLRALNFLTGSTGGGTEITADADVNATANNGSRASMKELAVETSLRDATTTRILKSTVVADSPVSPHQPQDDSALPDPPAKSGALSKSKLHASAGTLTTLNDEESKGAREKESSTSSTKKKPFSSFSSALKGLRRSFEALNRASTDGDGPSTEPATADKTDASPPVEDSAHAETETTAAQDSAPAAPTSAPTSTSPSPESPGTTLATITPQQLATWLAESKPLFLLDTRVPDIYESIHLANSFNVYAPPILQKRWRKNTGSGPAPTAASLATTPNARPMSAPAPTGRRTSVRGVVLESLVFPETERDRFRDAFLATDHIAIVFDETMAEHGAPGSVVWTVSNELLSQPGRCVYLLDGGFQSLVQVDGAAAHLVGPAAATAKPEAVASLAFDSSAPFQRTSSFSLRTSNLQRPKRMSLSLGPSGAAAAAPAPVGGDVPPPSALPNGGMRRLSTGAVPIALARVSPGLATTAAAANTGAILSHTLAEEDESAVSPIHPARAAAAAALAPQTQLLSPEMESPLETPTTPQDLEPSQILEWLWLGPDLFGHNPAAARQSLEQLQIGAILNMAAEVPPPAAHAMPMYKHFPCLDSADEKIELVLKDATAFIDQARAKNLNVYVHCKAGKSRSATAVMAYLIMHQGYSFDRAWAHVKEKRPAVAPNIGFFSVLREIGGANQDGGGELEIFLTPGQEEASESQEADQAPRAHSV